MSHLQQAIENMAANDPTLIRVKKIPVGTVVRFYGRSGAMRQGRNEFPAFVLKQHPDDGSLDLIVFFEAEDMIWEQRVRAYDEATNPHHSWSPVEPIEDDREVKPVLYGTDEASDATLALDAAIDGMAGEIEGLRQQMYGEYQPPDKSMIEYLADFDKRLRELEMKLERKLRK
jgi:hypothetical protein